MAPAVHAGGGGQRPCGVAGIPVGGRSFAAPGSAPALDGATRTQHGRAERIGDCRGRPLRADWLRGKAPPSPRDGFSAPLILRFAVDDLKAYGLEAAAAGLAKPSSRQLGDWLWNATATGAALYALRNVLLTQDDERLRLIVANFMVPAARAGG